MIMSELPHPLKEYLLLHLKVIAELSEIPIEYLEFAIGLMWAENFKKVVVRARALKF